jgi:hypothetical protein
VVQRRNDISRARLANISEADGVIGAKPAPTLKEGHKVREELFFTISQPGQNILFAHNQNFTKKSKRIYRQPFHRPPGLGR